MELIAKPDKATSPEIPEDWSCDYLDQHSIRGTGHTPNKKKDKYYDGSIVWVSLADSPNLDSGEINESKITISKEGIANSSTTLFPKGTVILSRDAGVGKSAIAGCELCVSQHFVTWICNEETLHNWYLYYWLQFQKGVFERIAMGSTVKTIGLTFFQEYHVPLPSYEEQRAIAEALSDVDALIERLDALIAKKRAVKTATMQRLLTGQQRLPGFDGAWETRRLGEVFDLLRTANNSRKDLFGYGDVAYIHYGDIHTFPKSHLDLQRENLPFIDALKVQNASPLQNGDLVMVDASEDYEGVGKSIEISGLNGQHVVAGLHTFLLRGNDAFLADGFKGYLQHMPMLKEALHRIATGTSVYGISKTKIKEVELRLPPVDEQKVIATVLSDMDAEIEALEARRDKTQALKQGMMQELLTGRTRLV